MIPRLFVLALMGLGLARAHGDHTFDLEDQDDKLMSYAERHMHTEHHIDSFDLASFFKLHDLNMDGHWDLNEIKAVYGLHNEKAKGAVNAAKEKLHDVDLMMRRVLQILDTNKDGRITLEEFEAGGKAGLPSFEGYKHLGHHYDEESEYFLHHEELYHSTPETQTDESYTHPEDLEHFRNHAHIEAEEDARERKFAGLEKDADLLKDHPASDPLNVHAHAPGEGPGDPNNVDPGVKAPVADAGQAAALGSDSAQQPLQAGGSNAGQQDAQTGAGAAGAKGTQHLQRVDAKGAPSRMRTKDGLGREELEQLGKYASDHGGYSGHGRPRSPEERLKAPYKYKMRKGFRADEF